MSKRYIKQREAGSDWAVVDLMRNHCPVASGLTEDEADVAADNWNKSDEQEKSRYA